MKFLVLGLGGSPSDLLRLGMQAGEATPGASAAEIWAYVLPNGKTAGQNLAEVNNAISAIQTATGFSLAEALSILLAVAAGRTTITPQGAGAARVEFEGVGGSSGGGTVVGADMQGSARTDVDLNP
jgi:hypothetical protein